MKASDTVMPFSQIEQIDMKNAESNFTDALYDVAREQAEISFKAGRESQVDAIANMYTVGIERGIKEVVEWMEGCMLQSLRDKDDKIYCRDYRVYDSEWQSKLREWEDSMTIVCLDKDKDIKGIMLTDKEGNLIALKNFEIPIDCIVLFVDRETWEVQSK